MRALKVAQQHFYSNKISKILDIGSGGGNTIFPLMEMYPNASFVASDLSAPMLKVLKKYYQEHYSDRSCSVMRINAEELIFQDNQFDLVVGGAILHHLFDPAKTVIECYRILKLGGAAVFFEPFEIGNQIIALIIQYVLDMNERVYKKSDPLSPEAVNFFWMLYQDFATRKGIDKSSEKFKEIDDKWLFTKSYFEEVSKRAGFKQTIIYPIDSLDNMFFNEINGLLQIGLQADVEMLPKWVLNHIHQIDEHFSKQARQELLIAGCIIFKK